MLTLVIAVTRIFAGAILKPLDLGQRVPPQVFGFVGSVDDGVRQAVVAVQVFGFVAQRVDFGDEVALGVVAGFPGAAYNSRVYGTCRTKFNTNKKLLTVIASQGQF
jgi:hypothetical protein